MYIAERVNMGIKNRSKLYWIGVPEFNEKIVHSLNMYGNTASLFLWVLIKRSKYGANSEYRLGK
jgi:hypothetical protein